MPAFQQDFEADSAGFSTPANRSDWVRSTDEAHAGSYSFFANCYTTSSPYEAEFTVTVAAAAELKYWHKSTASGGSAGHELYVNGVLQYTRSSTSITAWTEETVSLNAGTHTIKFVAIQNAFSPAEGVYVDDVVVDELQTDVALTLANDPAIIVHARRSNGGSVYYQATGESVAMVRLPVTPQGETYSYLVHAQEASGSEIIAVGSNLIDVEQADITDLFVLPGATTITLSVTADAGVQLEAIAVDALGYLVDIVKTTVPGGGTASLTLKDAAAFGKSSVRYRVTATKVNDVDSTVLDWVEHKFVDVTDQNASITFAGA